MSLYEPFGVGRIRETDYIIEAIDYVVPNTQLDPLAASATSITGFPTISAYLNTFEKRPLKFAIPSRYGAGFKYTTCYLTEGHILATATTVDGDQQFFLSQHFKLMLKQKGLSVARHSKDSSTAYPKLDTRTRMFEAPIHRRKTYSIQALYQDYWRYTEYVSHFVTGKTAVAEFAESDLPSTVIGSFDECMKVGDYFEKYYPQQPLSFNLQKLSLYQGYWRGKDTLATFRLMGEGKEILLSREGYALLKEKGLVVLTAQKQGETDEWRRLEMLLDLEVMQW